MPSQAQIDANRANARKSTGPVTASGKAASKRNATRHGLTSKQVVVQGEDDAAYEALRLDLMDAYAPANAAEEVLVEEIAQNFWRLQRARAIESDTFRMLGAGADPVIAFGSGERFDTIRRYMTSIERAYHRAMQQLETTQRIRRKAEQNQPETLESPDPEPAEIGFVSQAPRSKSNLSILPAPEREPEPRATIEFDPLPSPSATSNNQ